MGYRRIRDELDGHKGIHVNDKRVLRICRKYDIKSNIKWKPKSCTRGDRNPDQVLVYHSHEFLYVHLIHHESFGIPYLDAGDESFALSLIHRLAEYEAIQKLSSTKHYPIDRLCKYLNVTRSAYYRWGKYPKSNNELRNERLSTEIQRIHHQHPDMGYRRIRDELDDPSII